MRKMGIGLGVGINRSNYAQGIFNAYSARVVADGGVVESGSCVDAVSSLLQSASLLLIPSGYKGGKLYAEIPTNGNGDLTWTRGGDAFRTNASGVIKRVPWNLLQQSNAFTTSPWSLVGTPTLTANYATNPLTGANDAWRFQSASSGNRVIQVISNSLTTFSLYAKGTGTIQLRDSTGNYTVDVALTSSWQRVSLYIPAAFLNVQITSNGGCDATIYGAQLVEGTTAQTYLPTTDRLNFPRLSYMYGSCPSALLEPQRTNLILQSNTFNTSPWSLFAGATITSNSTTSPEGLTNATTLNSAGGGNDFLFQNVNTTIGTTYALTLYVKNINTSAARFFTPIAATPAVDINWSGSVITSVTGVGGTYSFASVGNGWYRVTAVVVATASSFVYRIYSDTNNTSKSMYIYGVQCEAGAYPTTYIPTTSATATRIADSFSRNNIYTNGLISASGGTWFVELRGVSALARDVFARSLGIANDLTSPTNAFYLAKDGTPTTAIQFRKLVSSVETTLFTITTGTCKLAVKWDGSTMDVFQNGTKVISSTSFTPTNMEFLFGNGNDVPKFIQQMALYPTPLTDAQCQTLTT